jgi:hypothetical protein
VSQAPDDKLVVPGVRIGKWTLDMTISSLVEMNGPQTAGAYFLRKPIQPIVEMGQTDWRDEVWAHSWGNLSLVAGTLGEKNQQLVLLLEESTDYRTAQGITIGPSGTNLEGVKAVYGEPTAATRPTSRSGSWRLIYDQTGLAMHFLNEIARSFVVFRPGTAREIWRW